LAAERLKRNADWNRQHKRSKWKSTIQTSG
jgi:hypothetical protein